MYLWLHFNNSSFNSNILLLPSSLVSLASEKLTIPVTVKIRVFQDIRKTVEYARMLERAGAKVSHQFSDIEDHEMDFFFFHINSHIMYIVDYW